MVFIVVQNDNGEIIILKLHPDCWKRYKVLDKNSSISVTWVPISAHGVKEARRDSVLLLLLLLFALIHTTTGCACVYAVLVFMIYEAYFL